VTETSELDKDTSATVLVVEDNRSLLEFFCALLRRDGYKILFAENGVQALEIVDNSPNDRIDILLSDVAMPYMGGIRLAEMVRETWPAIKVLLISALPYKEIMNRCDPSFIYHFLAKPMSVSGLSGKLRDISASN